MIKADFSKCKYLFLSYPKGFLNEYEVLIPFYNQLIELIPDNINLIIVVNTKKVKQELKCRFRHKTNLDLIVVNFWDEIWLRDCMGHYDGTQIYKPNYSPNYCNLAQETTYYRNINKLTKRILAETLSSNIIDIPLNIDGGNFVHNTKAVFMTNKVVEDNPGKDVSQIIRDNTGLEPIIVKRGYYDVIGHTDGYMAFKDENTLFVSQYQPLPYLKKDIHCLAAIKSIATDNGFKVLPMFDHPVDEHIKCACKGKKTRSCLFSARGIYINYIRFNNLIIMPEYSLSVSTPIENNWMNKKWLQSLGFDVLSINCDHLAKFGGSLHCISFQA